MSSILWSKPELTDEACSITGCHETAAWRVRFEDDNESVLLCEDCYSEAFYKEPTDA